MSWIFWTYCTFYISYQLNLYQFFSSEICFALKCVTFNHMWFYAILLPLIYSWLVYRSQYFLESSVCNTWTVLYSKYFILTVITTGNLFGNWFTEFASGHIFLKHGNEYYGELFIFKKIMSTFCWTKDKTKSWNYLMLMRRFWWIDLISMVIFYKCIF